MIVVFRILLTVLFCLYSSIGFAASTARQVDFLAAGIEKDGEACSGCKVYTYESGTTTAKATYLDRDKVSAATNPIILDSEGRAEVFADGLYKFVIKTSTDASYFDIDGLDYGVSAIEFTVLSQYASLEEAIGDIGSTKTVLVIDTAVTLTSNLTIPANVTLHVFKYDSVDLNGKTLTVNGGIVAPPIEWVVGTSGTFTGSPIVQYYDPTWTKSTVTDSATPSYKAITISGGTLIVPTIGDFTNATHSHIDNSTGGILLSSVRDVHRNLSISNSTERTVSITADEVLMQDTTGITKRVASVSKIANIASSGVNGLDAGSEAANTWYYIWLIGNSTTYDSLLSASSTSPALPSGYTFKARLGAVRNDASSNMKKFSQLGNYVSSIRELITGDVADFGVGTFTSKDISSFIPSTATAYLGTLMATCSASCAQAAGASFSTGTAATALGITTFAFTAGSSGGPMWVNVTGQTTYLYRASTDITVVYFYSSGWEY